MKNRYDSDIGVEDVIAHLEDVNAAMPEPQPFENLWELRKAAKKAHERAAKLGAPDAVLQRFMAYVAAINALTARVDGVA